MLRSLVRRGCDLNRSLLLRSLSVGSRSEVTGGCTPSSPPMNEVVHGRTRVVVDRSYESGVLGFESPHLGQQSSKFNREYLTRCSLGGMNALPVGWSRSAPPRLSQVRGFIQLKTNLEVADNSGAKRVQCIKVMKGSNAAKIGDIIMASVKDAQPRGKVKKGEVVTCVVVRAATQKLRRDGSEIKFDKNAVVLVNKQGEPIGTRIFGPVPHELRRRKLVKILTLAEYVA